MPTPGTDAADGRPLLLLVAAGAHLYREYLFESMAPRYRIHLLAMAEPSWELPYLAGHTVVADLDTATTVAAARAVAAREPVAGVLSWDESKILQTAEAARELGLPGGHPEAVLRCRDKFRSREALAAAGLDQPAHELVGDVEAALAAARRIGYPVVLKPRAASASFGVVLVRDDADLVARFAYPHDTTVPHMPRYDDEVLVEQYLADPEVSVDAAVHRGRVLPAFVAHKDVGFAPYFEETGHYVSHDDPLLADPRILGYLQAVHEALGFTDGWTHTELKLTPSGPQLIEVNGRLGGDLIPYLGMRASGIDPGLAASAVACGVAPDMRPTRHLTAAVRFCYVDEVDALVESVAFDETALPAGTDLAVTLAVPGDVVSPPPLGIVSGRIAFATVTGRDRPECRAALDQAQGALRLRTASPASLAGHRAG
jgi:biotin carboxylase